MWQIPPFRMLPSNDDNGQLVINIATNIRKTAHDLYKLGMGRNLAIGLAAGSYGFSLSWDPLLLSELSNAFVHVSLTFSCILFLLA
jgi:hypothetical protein